MRNISRSCQRLTGILLALLAGLSSPSGALAAVTITHVQPQPSSGPEWVVITNTGSAPTDLTNWQLRDSLTTPSIIATLGSESLGAGAMKLIELASAKLNNTGDSVTLLDNNGAVIDSMSYTSSEANRAWIFNPTTHTWYLSEPGFYPNLISPTPSPSPSSSPLPFPTVAPSLQPTPSPTILPTPTPLPTSTPTPIPSTTPTPSPVSQTYTPELTELKITAINPCPVSGELESLTMYYAGSQPAVLTNWSIIDQSGNSKQLALSLSPHSSFTWTWSGSLLNNAGDTVALRSNLGQTQTAITIPACPESGAVLYSTTQGWQWNSELDEQTTSTTTNSTAVTTNPTSNSLSTNLYEGQEDPLLSTWVTAGQPMNTTCLSTDLTCPKSLPRTKSSQLADQLVAAYQNLPLPHFSLQPSSIPVTPNLPSAQPPHFLAGFLFLTSGSSFSLGGLVGIWREIRYNRT